jgi:hypothetical protein
MFYQDTIDDINFVLPRQVISLIAVFIEPYELCV